MQVHLAPLRANSASRHFQEESIMLSDKIQAAFNAQVGHEFANSIQYIAIANYFEGESLKGLAKIFYKQAQEEHEHAMKFTQFLIDTNGAVKIPALPAPQNNFASAEAAAQLALDAEIRTTNQINDLLSLALEEKNYAAQNFLQWFVEEQVEEIATAATNLDIIKKAGPNVLMVEAYLAHVNKD
jgi:ferritin